MANTFFTGGMEAIDAGQVEQATGQTRVGQGQTRQAELDGGDLWSNCEGA